MDKQENEQEQAVSADHDLLVYVEKTGETVIVSTGQRYEPPPRKNITWQWLGD